MMVNHLNVLTSNHLYYFCLQMSTSYDGIEDLLKTLDRLQKNLDTLLGATSEASSEIEVPQSHQRDSLKRRKPSGCNNVPQQRDTNFKQRPHPSTSMKDVVCHKCQHTGHLAKNCTSAYTTSGKFLGVGPPPPNHYWTRKNAFEKKKRRRAAAAATAAAAAAATTAAAAAEQQQQQ